jgi:hypothetical protein
MCMYEGTVGCINHVKTVKNHLFNCFGCSVKDHIESLFPPKIITITKIEEEKPIDKSP